MSTSLAVAAVDSLDGTLLFNRDIALAVKRDGTWIQAGTAQPGSNWEIDGNKIVYNNEINVLNDSGSDQEFTDAAIIASQDLGQTISFLNSDENAVTSLLGGITPLQNSPITIANGQTLRILTLEIPLT